MSHAVDGFPGLGAVGYRVANGAVSQSFSCSFPLEMEAKANASLRHSHQCPLVSPKQTLLRQAVGFLCLTAQVSQAGVQDRNISRNCQNGSGFYF